MKYENTVYTEKELNDLCLIKGKTKANCSQCGEFTAYIDYCTEQYICSQECMDKQNEWLNKYCR